MYGKHSVWLLLAAAVCSSISSQAQAADSAGWFAFVRLGQTSFKGYELERYANKLDDSDTGWEVGSGYRWGSFGVMLGYNDLGALNAGSNSDYQPPEAQPRPVPPTAADSFVPGPVFKDKIEAKGVTASAIYMLPVGKRCIVTGRIGLYHWKQKVRYEEPSFTDNASATGTSPLVAVGFGVGLDTDKRWTVHVSYGRHFNVGDLGKTGHENDIDLFSVGAAYGF